METPAFLQRQKSQLLTGAKNLQKNFVHPESDKLVALVEALPIVGEEYNPEEDKPISDYFVNQVNWRQSMVGKLVGVKSGIGTAANLIASKCRASINDIAADDELLEIGQQLVIVLDLVYDSVADKNADNFVGQYWQQQISQGN